MLPESGRTAHIRIFETVVLPQPLSPTRPKASLRAIVKLTSSTASTDFERLPSQPPLRVRKVLHSPATSSNRPERFAGPPPGVLTAPFRTPAARPPSSARP